MMLPHNTQKHNNNQTSLQHIRNLPYHQDKTATSDDCINSLTTYNNHYTLLYPDLVQELFNLSLHNSNSSGHNSHIFSGLGVHNTKYSSLNSSISSSLDSLLSPRDILFFLQIVSLYQLELSKGHSSITYPSLKLAKLLGVDASYDSTSVGSNTPSSANMRATILKMTAKLESLGLLKVFRRKRSNGMDKANKLVPVLPDRLYDKIKDSYTNLKVSDSSKSDHESNLEHILRTKLFVPIELEFMKSLFKDGMPSKYKLFFLNCIMSAYRNFRYNSSISNSRADKDTNSVFYDSQDNFVNLTNKLSFSATSRELMKKNNISRSTLDRIFRYVKQQGDNFFLKVEHKYTKSNDIDCNRYDKSIFVLSINPLVFPLASTNLDQLQRLHEEELESGHMNDKNCRIDRINCDELQAVNSSIFPDTYNGFKTAWSKNQPSIIIKTALNNKDIIVKNKYSKNIDENLDVKNEALDKITTNNQIKPQTFSQTSHSQHLESEQSSLSSKSLKNSIKDFINALPPPSNTNSENASRTIKDNLSRKNRTNITSNVNVVVPKKISSQPKASNNRKNKEFKTFYPLSEKEVSMLNFKANREFDTNFINQLLLKLYIKYPEKRFKNKFTFLSYMVKALRDENHQGPLVNNPSFRFSCNIDEQEKRVLEYERYLSQIENSFDTSKEMCVKKKIAGRFNAEVAYKILTAVEFKLNPDNSFVTVFIPSRLDLSERQKEALSEQLEVVYGINGYYIQELEELIPPLRSKTSDIDPKGPLIDILAGGSQVETTKENTAWLYIRKGLIEELGEAIDAVWFSKAEAVECNDTKTLTLTMPTKFMADFMRNNYSHVIRRLASSVGIKSVEYVKICI